MFGACQDIPSQVKDILSHLALHFTERDALHLAGLSSGSGMLKYRSNPNTR